MKNLKTKSKTIVTTFVLMLTFVATLAALPVVSAHDPPWTVPTWAYISLTNNPIGVGQTVVFIYWCNALPPTAQGQYGDRWTWTVEVTDPDGNTEILGPWKSDPVGGGWNTYTPDQVGTYTFVAKMEDHKITGEPFPPIWNPMSFGYYDINDTYLGDTSDPYYLTVQDEQIEGWSETPLPTEYWTRPINSMNRYWWPLAGNWLAGAAQNVGPTTNFGYGTGPESAHIMWSTPIWAGGIMDARFGDIGYQTAHYEGLEFNPPIVLNGKLYYNVRSLPRYGWYCLDLYTGEVEYFHNTTGPVTGTGGGFDLSGELAVGKLAFGQIYNYDSPNQHGGMPYLWSTGPSPASFGGDPLPPEISGNTWMMFDAFTGNYICSIENVPTSMGAFGVEPWGTQVYGEDGSILMYNIVGSPNPMGPFFPDVAPFYLQVWNTSRAIWYEEVFVSNEYWMWRPVLNMTYDGNNGYSLNVSIPELSGGIRCVREDEFVIGGTAGSNDAAGVVPGNLWALSLKPGEEGTVLWNYTFTPPYDVVPPEVTGIFGAGLAMGTVDPEDGVFLFENPITLERWGYDLETGEHLWGPTPPEPSLNYYGMSDNIYQGKLLSYGYGGVLTAYNITTGERLWNYTASQEGYESPYGNYPIGIACIADGKIYLTSSEHSPTQPLWRGSYLRCIDAETGDELWKINNWGMGMGAGSGAVIADGYIVSLNAYDNQIYCYGKGPSATTVTASPKVTALGSSIIIEGTVTDECAGAKGLVQEGKFKSVPAISDEDMGEWMEYLYMQQPCPMDYTGVPVKLEAFGEDGSYIDIGTVTSDPYGNFKHAWTPPDEGLYTVMATFEGSKSYGPSYAGTGLSVGPAPEAPPEPEPEEAPAYTAIDLAIIAAVVVAIVIGLVNLWALRKRT